MVVKTITLKKAFCNYYRAVFLCAGMLCWNVKNVAQQNVVSVPAPVKTASERLAVSLSCFDPTDSYASYSLTLCADLPDNSNPFRVHVKTETGHVFLIFTKISNKDTLNRVFGFYPRRPASSLIFKNVRCEILNNGNREYNAAITVKLNTEKFDTALQTAVKLACKKYNLNKYNCYNYALDVFNTVSGLPPIIQRKVRFPFIFGRGGSPCVLYEDLQHLKETHIDWNPLISFGLFRSPAVVE